MDHVESAYLRKVLRRIIPLLFLGILLGYIDRANIAYAAVRMNADMGLSPTAYGWAAGLFFFGYFAFEIPGTMALARLGARRWMSFLVLCWGIISVLMALVSHVPTFFLLRFLLGVAEAGFFPGTILYMNYWVPREHRSRIGSYFMIAVPLAMVVGGPLSGILMQLDGHVGMHGWQWMFLLEGLPCFLLAFWLSRSLIDRPDDATWLTDEEKAFISASREQEEADKRVQGGREGARSLLDIRLALLCCVTFGGPAVATGVTFWLPQVMADSGLGVLETGFLSALPFAIAGLALFYWGGHSDRTGERAWHLALPVFVAAAGLAGTLVTHTHMAQFAMLLVASLGMFSYLPVAWAASHALFHRSVAAIGFGIISMTGALAGFTAPILLGMLRQATGGHQAGIAALAVIAALAGLAGLAFGAVSRHRSPTAEKAVAA